ncbi:MAG: glycosyltransferase family 39 protein, partial [Planctomycetota bacterium]
MTDLWSRIRPSLGQPWFGPLCLAILATVMVMWALDPAGDYPARAEGPGLTVDEIFNVDLGARLADHLLTGDFPGAIRVGQTLPDHPPLGRLWLGLFHEFVLLLAPPHGQHAPLVVAAARVGSAVAFGILVWLVGWTAARWFGNPAGWVAAAGLILMPRVFGHAHLAALETVLNLTYVAAVLSVARTWSASTAPTVRTALLSGLWLGLALLTKIQAIFIPIPVLVWAVLNWRQRAVWPLLIWGVTGVVVFVCGWPWLWLDPVGHVLKYLGHASERSVIQVWYCGQMFADRAVPWHYPWVLFATTVPVGLHLLGLAGVFVRQPLPVTTSIGLPKIAVEWFL